MKSKIQEYHNNFFTIGKTKILAFTIMTFMAGTILTSCGETSKKDAKTVKEDTKELNKDLEQGAKDTSEEIKTTVKADWENFKTASETAVENTENNIKDLREKIAKASQNEKTRLTVQLDKLELKNKELKEKLAERAVEFKQDIVEFNESTIESEKRFEREFNHDMKEMGTALKDLFKNNED
ncbi:hypothetical protein [Winogradskyella psychrotolerans]|nr:hypothetical protein [Winogradskyella psychrotolerans]